MRGLREGGEEASVTLHGILCGLAPVAAMQHYPLLRCTDIGDAKDAYNSTHCAAALRATFAMNACLGRE